MDYLLFRTKDEPERVLTAMKAILKQFSVVYVQDIYDLVNLPSTYIDNKMGWTSLDDFKIREVPEGFALDLPQPTEVGKP